MAVVGGFLLSILDCGISSARLEVRSPAEPFDAVVVPGCPSRPDGKLSGCQARRATWAAILWERGHAQRFITSGGAVYSPFVEAEALAAAMTALGVPAERIYLEPSALHTDENIYNALRLAQSQGWRRLAVASDLGHTVGACQMMESWQGPCGALTLDARLVRARTEAAQAVLDGVRAKLVPAAEFIPLRQRERERELRTQRLRRLPSPLLYPLMRIRSFFGDPWVPFSPEVVPVVTWAERSRALAETDAAP